MSFILWNNEVLCVQEAQGHLVHPALPGGKISGKGVQKFEMLVEAQVGQWEAIQNHIAGLLKKLPRNKFKIAMDDDYSPDWVIGRIMIFDQTVTEIGCSLAGPWIETILTQTQVCAIRGVSSCDPF